jgi:hypothetical protein
LVFSFSLRFQINNSNRNKSDCSFLPKLQYRGVLWQKRFNLILFMTRVSSHSKRQTTFGLSKYRI